MLAKQGTFKGEQVIGGTEAGGTTLRQTADRAYRIGRPESQVGRISRRHGAVETERMTRLRDRRWQVYGGRDKDKNDCQQEEPADCYELRSVYHRL